MDQAAGGKVSASNREEMAGAEAFRAGRRQKVETGDPISRKVYWDLSGARESGMVAGFIKMAVCRSALSFASSRYS